MAENKVCENHRKSERLKQNLMLTQMIGRLFLERMQNVLENTA